MKKILMSFSLAIMLSFFVQQSAEAAGLFYTNATYPITATGVTAKDLTQLKKGVAKTTNVLYFVEVGDAGIDDAVKRAGIKKITHIDVNEKSVFIFWRQLTVTVYGE